MKNYQVGNWSEYNRSLINRGSITLWLSPDAVKTWTPSKGRLRKAGRPLQYSDDMILCMLYVREVYRLPLRATQGFFESFFALLGLDLPVPNYSLLSKRAKSLGKRLAKLRSGKVCELVIDSTGLKVAGDGEWNAKKHGPSKRRQWRKVHLAMDPVTHRIISVKSTSSNVADSKALPDLLADAPKGFKVVYADGAYDGKPSRECIHSYGASCVVPPPKNAVLRKDASSAIQERNRWVSAIQGLGGDGIARSIAKKLIGYHKRSVVETTMSRLKAFFGGELRARSVENQNSETLLRCHILNRFTDLGMPSSSWS